MSIATLRALHAIIGESLDQIASVYSARDLDFPSLDTPYDGSSSGEKLANTDPTVRLAIQRAVSACGHIAASLQNPFMALCDVAMGLHPSSAIRVLQGLPCALPLLTEAGEAGVHVKLIAEREGMKEENAVPRLAHIFRLLATHHILREISPGDIFALNRISGYMSLTGPKSLDEFDPLKRYEGANGGAAFMDLATDELFKTAPYLLESLLPPDHPSRFMLAPAPPSEANAPSNDAISLTAFNYAYRTRQQYFTWIERKGVELNVSESEQQYRVMRFGKAMAATVEFDGPEAIWDAFNWRDLPPGAMVVDVGGGIGTTTMVLAKELQGSGVKFFIQDREPTVKLGVEMWKSQCPELLDTKAVTFLVQDFFTPQPEETRAPAVYLLRSILHMWPDKVARQILLRLREASSETTTLISGDQIISLACHDPFIAGSDVDIEGVSAIQATHPLLPNLGKGNSNPHWLDLTIQTMFGAQERTLKETITLCASAGWKVVSYRRSPGFSFGYVVAKPIPGFETSIPTES